MTSHRTSLTIRYSPELQQNHNLLGLAVMATEVIKGEIGPHAGPTTIDWNLSHDREVLRPILSLTVRSRENCKVPFYVPDALNFEVLRQKFREWCSEVVKGSHNAVT